LVAAVPWAEELAAKLGRPVDSMHLLPGGASKEAWAVEAGGERLLVRRALGGVIHEATLPLEHEFQVLEAALEAGVKVPRPVAYLGELGGREAFAMEFVEGETIGRRIVRNPPDGLGVKLAEELAKIHAIRPDRLPFLHSGDILGRFEHELDSVGEPHPAIEYGLWWLRENRPEPLPDVVSHGDFRIGNVVVSERGLEYLLDWEFAHLSDPREDVSWPFVRAWRFGADERRLGGVGEPRPYLERYAELTGREISEDDLAWWEVLGNVKWAVGCLTQCRRHLTGLDRSVEYAVLGRMAAEMEYELLDLIDKAPLAAPISGRAGLPARPSAPLAGRHEIESLGVTHDRPTAPELIEAVFEFLSGELLPTLDDHRLKFRTLVAMNALAIARRELEASNNLLLSHEDVTELARRIRAGEPPDDALPLLKEHVAAKLRISNPGYLEKYE
jgi:aminoglycoside phosphotransferase (APT) family kinase protein